MNLIRLDPIRWPYSLGQLRQDEPTYSFSAKPSKTEFAYFNVYHFEDVVTLSQPPGFDPETHWLQQRPPIEVDGVLTQQWALIAYTDEELAARYRATHPPKWIEFWSVLPPDVDALLAAAQAVSPRLALSLGVGLGKAADGDSRVFLGAWGSAAALGLVSPELITAVQALATANDLPGEFVEGLEP